MINKKCLRDFIEEKIERKCCFRQMGNIQVFLRMFLYS